jgi:hypothetical protein
METMVALGQSSLKREVEKPALAPASSTVLGGSSRSRRYRARRKWSR